MEILSGHPSVKIVGKNSAGALHFSNGVTFMLPYSGIITYIPTLFHDMENDAPEGVGYKPTPGFETDHVDLDSLF